MKARNSYLSSILLTIEIFILCLAALFIRILIPSAILPHISLPMLVLLTLIPLTCEYYLVKAPHNLCLFNIILAGISFTLLPLCAGIDVSLPLWQLCIVSIVTYGISAAAFASIERRITSGPACILVPIASAFMLYLASQCLQGLI